MLGDIEDEINNIYNNSQFVFLTNTENFETESFHLMQSMGLIHKSKYCKDCNKNMQWYPSGRFDLFEGICLQCKQTCSIRQGSPLETIDCSYYKILEVLWAWCNCEDIEKTAVRLGIEQTTVMNIFLIAGLAAQRHIKKHISQWKIGGPGIIVLIDTFPETYFGANRISNRPILCLAELKGFPLTIVFHPLQTDSRNEQDTEQKIKANCQTIIRDFVHPESAVVARRNATYCSYEDILSNQPQFNVLASDEGLLKHESVGRNLQTILSTIWEEAVYICMTAQYLPDHLMKSFLVSQMWKNKYSHRAQSLILTEIANLVNDGNHENQ